MKLRGKENRKKLTIYLAVVFLIQELIIRICFPLPEVSNFDRIHYTILEPNGQHFDHERNKNWYWHSIPDTNARFIHEMNMYGFRDKEWSVQKTKGSKRILFVGDSFVEGVMAQQDETIPAAFGGAANDPTFDIMNAGTAGLGLSGYLQFMSDAIPLYKPDVVFLCIYANDLGSTTPPREPKPWQPEMYSFFTPRFLEIINQANTNGSVSPIWSSETVPFFDPVPSIKNLWTGHEDELKQVVSPEMAECILKGELNPYRVEGINNEVYGLNQPLKMGITIPFFKQICEENGCEPILVYIPSRNQVTKHYYPFERKLINIPETVTFDITTEQYQVNQKIIGEQCRQHDIPYIDLTNTIREQEAQGNHLFWNYDEHMRGKGYQLLGKTIWERWSEM